MDFERPIKEREIAGHDGVQSSTSLWHFCRSCGHRLPLFQIIFYSRWICRQLWEPQSLSHSLSLSLFGSSRRQVGWFSSKIKVMSPSGTKVRQLCLQPVINDLVVLKLEFFRCDAKPLCAHHSPGSLKSPQWVQRRTNLNMLHHE